MIQRSSFVTTTRRVSHLVLVLAYAAYSCVRPVYSECCYSYSEQKLPPARSPSPTAYSVALTASSWVAINSPGMTYKATVTFSSGYFIELIPAGCTLVNQGTVTCSQAGMSMLNLAFQKITAVGDSGGSYLLVAHDAPAVVGDEEREGRVVRGMRKDYSTVPGPSPVYKPPTPTPLPPPAVVSVQICGEFCTLSSSCPVLTPNMTSTPTPTRPLNATATSMSLSKTTASPTHTGQMVTPPGAAPEAEPANTVDKTAVIIGSVFAAVVVAFAVGYALMRRNIALGGRGGKKKKKEADQEDIKYIRPPTPAPPALPQPPAPVAAPATATMTMRQLDSASGGGGGGVDLESQSRFKKPLPQPPSNTTSTRTATNTAAATAAAALMLARGRSVQEAAPTRNDRQQPPGNTLAGGGNVGADMRYLQERQRVLAVNANTSASSAPALVEMSARLQASAPKYNLPQPPPPADPLNVSVPVSISTMASLPPSVSTAAAVNGSTTARAAPVETRTSNNSEGSAVDTADLEYLYIPVSSNNASTRQKNGTPSPTPPLGTRGAEKEEVLEDVDLDDGGGYGESDGALLMKSKSMRHPWSSRRGADAAGGNGVAASSSAAVTFADTAPLRRVASAGVGSSSGSKATINYNNSSNRNQSNNNDYYNNNSANTSNYYPQQQQQQKYQQQHRQQQQLLLQYQQKQQKMGWAQSQDDLLARERSMPRTMIGAVSTSTSTTTAMNGGFPPRTMNTQQQQQQQRRADPRGLYGYL